MDFNITLAAKTTGWGDLKTWVPALVGVIVGATLAFCFGYAQERLKRRHEANSVRSLIYKEISRLHERVGQVSGETPEAQVISITYLTQLPIFNAYLEKLTLLSKEEQTCLLDLHFWLRIFGEDNRLPAIMEKVSLQEKVPLEVKEISLVKSIILTIQNQTSRVLECMDCHIDEDKPEAEIKSTETDEDKDDN